MKRFILTNTILSIVFILLSFNFDAALMHFLLAGEIPGTSLVVSPSLMMFGSSLLFATVIAAIVRSQVRTQKKHSHA